MTDYHDEDYPGKGGVERHRKTRARTRRDQIPMKANAHLQGVRRAVRSHRSELHARSLRAQRQSAEKGDIRQDERTEKNFYLSERKKAAHDAFRLRHAAAAHLGHAGMHARRKQRQQSQNGEKQRNVIREIAHGGIDLFRALREISRAHIEKADDRARKRSRENSADKKRQNCVARFFENDLRLFSAAFHNK